MSFGPIIPRAVNLLTSIPFTDVFTSKVAVYDQSFVQVFPGATIVNAVVKEDSLVMQHPLETGASIIDHKVTLPVEIELSLILKPLDFNPQISRNGIQLNFASYRDTYQAIRQLFLNATLLTVQTKASTYNNMLISAMPHEESTDVFNTITIALKLREALFVTPQTESLIPKATSSNNTVARGQIQPVVATVPQTAAATHAISNIPIPPLKKGIDYSGALPPL